MRCYKVLKKQIFSHGKYKIIPIRNDDRFDIMKWRNEQIYHLRQKSLLTIKIQDNYFKNTISPLFNQEFPTQILFSFMFEEKCIGYGGLVHINWKNKRAEISFIMETSLEKKFFIKNWKMFLSLIENVAFNDLNLKKLFVYAYDIRKHLYPVLTKNGYLFTKRKKDDYLFNNQKLDALIYSKHNNS
jgi:hypothetical protein